MNPDDPYLDAEQLGDLFAELSDELTKRGQNASMLVVGGAAMALAYDGSRTTQDVDALFRPASTVRAIARDIGRRHDLPDDWLNDAVKGLVPPNEQGRRRAVFQSTALLVQVVSPEHLLAMKLHSGRAGRDRQDAAKLWRHLGYSTPEEGMTLLATTYEADQLLPRHRFVVEEVAAMAADLTRTPEDTDVPSVDELRAQAYGDLQRDQSLQDVYVSEQSVDDYYLDQRLAEEDIDPERR